MFSPGGIRRRWLTCANDVIGMASALRTVAVGRAPAIPGQRLRMISYGFHRR